MSKIPIVFSFNDDYALPASIAIQSLLDNKKSDTEYQVIVLHNGLREETKREFNSICKNIQWVKVDLNVFETLPPTGWSGIEAYYRLFMANLLLEYDKVIYSDVDVLFCRDLSEIFKKDISNFDWAGIIAERKDERNGIHSHFEENKKEFVYMNGFMIANLKNWRDKNLFARFIKTITTHRNKLKMFELDILNLCADSITDVPFNYCVLENIFDTDDITNAKEYPWLVNAYGKERLLNAKKNPVIIHYAGKNPKIWLRNPKQIPSYYLKYIKKSPFYNKDYYYPCLSTKIKIFFIWLSIKLCPFKKVRNFLKEKRRKISY